MYSSPVLHLPDGEVVTPSFDWDPLSSALSLSLPEPTFPLVIAFGLGTTIPDIKGGLHLSFPSFKFGAKAI